MRKITIIHHASNIGGAGISLLQTVNLLKKNFELEVYCPSDSDMYELLKEKKVKVIPYDVPLGSVHYYSGGPKIISRTFFKCLYEIIRYKSIWKNIVKKIDSDIVLINSVTTSWLVKEIKKETNKPVICFVRETFPENGNRLIFNYYNKIFNLYCNEVFFISDYDKNLYFKGNNKGVVVRNSISEDFFEKNGEDKTFKKLGVDKKKFNILFVGGMNKLKGTEVIVKAMRDTPIDFQLVIAGYHQLNDDKYSQGVNEFISENHLYNKIKFIGVIKDISEVYEICDVLVFPSTKPHQARPVFEAGAKKKPVIVSDFIELRESIQNGVNGLIFTPGKSDSLKEKLLYLYNNPDHKKRMGLMNYEYSRKKHSYSQVENVLNRNIHSVIKESVDE